MSLTLHFHPLSSFCHKALIALYENDTPFEPQIVNLMDPAEAAAFKKLWPCGQFPVLQDGRTIPESSASSSISICIIRARQDSFLADPKLALQVRLRIGSTISIFTCTCRRSSATSCVRTARKTRMASENARQRIMVSLDMIDAEMAGQDLGRWAKTSPWPTAPRRHRCSTSTGCFRSPIRTRTRRVISAACWSVRPMRG